MQVWSGPWSGPAGSKGSAEHLGSVDWSYDTPSRHYITIYRVMVTAKGAAAGHTTEALLAQVLELAGITSTEQAVMQLPPPRDPFRSEAIRERATAL